MTNLKRHTQKMLPGHLKMLKHELGQEYARWNKNVFNSFLKESIDWAELIFMGRLFQTRGPATEKDRSPNDRRVLGTSRMRVSADHKPLLRPTEDVSAT